MRKNAKPITIPGGEHPNQGGQPVLRKRCVYLRERGEVGSWKTLARVSSHTAVRGLYFMQWHGKPLGLCIRTTCDQCFKRSLATVWRIVAKDSRQGRNSSVVRSGLELCRAEVTEAQGQEDTWNQSAQCRQTSWKSRAVQKSYPISGKQHCETAVFRIVSIGNNLSSWMFSNRVWIAGVKIEPPCTCLTHVLYKLLWGKGQSAAKRLIRLAKLP